MSREKTERLFNLTLALLGTRNYLTKSAILNSVQGYQGASESADRMFERDKDDLRELGIPIEVRQIDPLFDDEPGYRIDRSKYQLPPLLLTAREMALLSVAAQAWEQAALAGPAHEGLRKLIASGADPEPDFQTQFTPNLSTTDPAFEPVWRAVRDAQAIRFEYQRAGESISKDRTVDPWGLLTRNGIWYLIGRDHDADSARVFRLSRMREVKASGKSGAFTVPAGIDIWSHARLLDPQRSAMESARLRIADGRAGAIRRRSVEIEPGLFQCEFADIKQFASEIASLGGAVSVIEPSELKEAVKELLTDAVRKYG